MVFFVGNPTNVVICEGFAVNNAAFTAYTVLPFVVCSLSCFVVLAFQFRHAKYIPRKLDVSGDLDVRAVLRDPVGASVGGALLGTCLIVIIVVLSFSNVQVWMISLPFAVSKFLWDLTWDTYRFRYLMKNKTSSSSIDEEDDDVWLRQLRQLRRRETRATITKEESDLKHDSELKVEIARRPSAVAEDEEDDVMLRELKRWKTHATITTEESDSKHKLKIEIANAVANGVANEAANRRVNTVQPIKILSPANTDAIADTVANGAANRRVDTVQAIEMLSPVNTEAIVNEVANGAARRVDTMDPIKMLSPANIVIFDEPLPILSVEDSRSGALNTTPLSQQSLSTPPNSKPFSSLLLPSSNLLHRFSTYLSIHFPTFHSALPRLPFALVPFAFSQFILIEGLSRQGWIDIFAEWLVIATKREMFTTVWVVGILGVLLCNASGTNIGATILLTKIVNTAALTYVPPSSGPEVNIKAFLRSAAIALAVASNIGAVSFTFSASLAGLLWRQILSQKGIYVTQKRFAWWNLAPVLVMTAVGLAMVSAEMAVLY